MSYIVIDDMIEKYGEEELIILTDKSNPPTGNYESVTIENAISDAQAEIDAYLSSRYALPLTEVPGILKRITCEIARYHLFGSALTEEVEKKYTNAIRFLKEVATRKASIGINETTGTAPASESSADYFSSGRAFDTKTLGDYSG